MQAFRFVAFSLVSSFFVTALPAGDHDEISDVVSKHESETKTKEKDISWSYFSLPAMRYIRNYLYRNEEMATDYRNRESSTLRKLKIKDLPDSPDFLEFSEAFRTLFPKRKECPKEVRDTDVQLVFASGWNPENSITKSPAVVRSARELTRVHLFFLVENGDCGTIEISTKDDVKQYGSPAFADCELGQWKKPKYTPRKWNSETISYSGTIDVKRERQIDADKSAALFMNAVKSSKRLSQGFKELQLVNKIFNGEAQPVFVFRGFEEDPETVIYVSAREGIIGKKRLKEEL